MESKTVMVCNFQTYAGEGNIDFCPLPKGHSNGIHEPATQREPEQDDMESAEAEQRRKHPHYQLIQRLDDFLHKLCGDEKYKQEADQLHGEIHEAAFWFVTRQEISVEEHAQWRTLINGHLVVAREERDRLKDAFARVQSTNEGWGRPEPGTRRDIVGIRNLPGGRQEYLMHNEALGYPYYLAVSAPRATQREEASRDTQATCIHGDFDEHGKCRWCDYPLPAPGPSLPTKQHATRILGSAMAYLNEQNPKNWDAVETLSSAWGAVCKELSRSALPTEPQEKAEMPEGTSIVFNAGAGGAGYYLDVTKRDNPIPRPRVFYASCGTVCSAKDVHDYADGVEAERDQWKTEAAANNEAALAAMDQLRIERAAALPTEESSDDNVYDDYELSPDDKIYNQLMTDLCGPDDVVMRAGFQRGWLAARTHPEALPTEAPRVEDAKDDVIAKARCIRHWHDTGRNGEGMIVSSEAVRDLWASLERLDRAQQSSVVGSEPKEK